ncbi:hypothetical protein ScPMuIL_013724 [Solemya velum]
MSFGNTFQCFRDHSFLGSRLYTFVPEDVDPLMARLFGMWTLLSASLRLYCAISIYNKGVYNLTLLSFYLRFAILPQKFSFMELQHSQLVSFHHSLFQVYQSHVC